MVKYSVNIKETEYGSFSLHFTNPEGVRRRISVGKDRRYAERLARKFEDWLLDGKDPERELRKKELAEKAKSVTIREFFSVFMERHGSMQSKSMQLIYQNSYNNIVRCKELAILPLGDFSKSIVLNYMYSRMKTDGVTSATVNREASFLRCMLSRATDWEILPTNPLNGLRLLKEADKRDVFLTREQAEKLIGKLKEPVASIVEFAIYSGFRRDNILSLKIEQIRFYNIGQGGEVELLTKGNKRGIFPLGPNAVEVLKRVIGSRKAGYVFLNQKTGERFTDVHCTFDRAVNKLGLKVGDTKLRFHDLRHVFATWLHREGVSLDTLRPLLGHSNRSTTDRYTTIDRLECGKALTLMPQIRRTKQA